jgi:hypothetical protein
MSRSTRRHRFLDRKGANSYGGYALTLMQFLVQAKAWASQQLGKATDRPITQAES